MYSDYQQTGTRVQPAPISKRLPQNRKSPLYASSFVIVRYSSGRKAETSKPYLWEGAMLRNETDAY